MTKLTLSFDNGPSPDTTPEVLDVLAQRDIKGSFFVCGKNILDREQRSIVERARREGHRIGNHTFSHTVVFGKTKDPDALQAEIGRTQDLLGNLSDADRLFRPYGGGGIIGPGLLSLDALKFLQEGKYTCVLWNSIPRDWEDIKGWPKRALKDVRSQDWTLMVLHDLPTGAMDQLPRFLDSVRREGVEVVQAFPQTCVPIRRGVVLGPIEHIIATDPSPRA
jgi:peptidoglycan/xylan/chitin deacetylase (PgdA/CDA1 family)